MNDNIRALREDQKLRAVQRVHKAFSYLKEEGHQLDAWEYECLNCAIGFFRLGQYERSNLQAGLALTPPNRRALEWWDPDAAFEPLDIDILRQDFDAAVELPLRLSWQFAHISPKDTA